MQDKNHQFIAYFDNLGFECIVDITSAERQQLMQTIKGENLTPAFNINAMVLRARFNPQRFPEIWIFESEVDETTLRTLAEEQPQQMADMIRLHGRPLFVTSKTEQKNR